MYKSKLLYQLINNRKNNVIIKTIKTSTQLSANVSFNLSDIGEGIREVVVKEWFVKVGDKVSQFDDICEVQSDKASVTITSRYDGIVKKLHYNVDDVASVGKPLIDIETEEDEIDNTSSTSSPPQHETTLSQEVIKNEEIKKETCEILCIPSVRRLAKEHNLDLTLIKGTGKNGRILKENILSYLNKKNELGEVTKEDKIEEIKGFKKAMVKTMTAALKIPHFVYSDEIIVTKLKKLRMEIKTNENLKLSFMPFFIKATSNALKSYPILNASVDENCEKITYKANHNIGIAMDTAVGLAVPVIKNVQNLSILEINKELLRLMESGKKGVFSPEELTGATFSISNIGIIGGTYTKPVITPPQVAIIALGAAKLQPKFDEDQNIIAEEVIHLSGSADHRIIDGVTMAKFVLSFKKQIENPYLLFLNV